MRSFREISFDSLTMESMKQDKLIVFVCEHGAAKSVVAATYFNRLIRESGMPWRAIARGTNPEKELSPQTIEGLSKDHLTPTESFPQRLTEADLRSAQHVIAFCELPTEDPQQAVIEHWNDIPPVSENYEMAREAIVKRIRYFMNQIQ